MLRSNSEELLLSASFKIVQMKYTNALSCDFVVDGNNIGRAVGGADFYAHAVGLEFGDFSSGGRVSIAKNFCLRNYVEGGNEGDVLIDDFTRLESLDCEAALDEEFFFTVVIDDGPGFRPACRGRV